MKKIFLVGLLSLLGFSAATQASLVIHPIRVQVGEKERSFEVSLMNDSKTTNTYRLEWQEKKGSEQAMYVDLTEAQVKAENFPIASGMIRFSPRQVTLKPGERQTIKLSFRRPARLADGEYRSHLLFKALPPVKEAEASSAGSAFQINLVASFSIPVIIQQGTVSNDVKFQSAQIYYSAGALDKNFVEVKMQQKNAKYSAHGHVEAYWTPKNGREEHIATTKGVTFWPEVTNNTLKLSWIGTKFATEDGTLRIVYQGARNYRGTTFFNESIQIKRGDIKPAM